MWKIFIFLFLVTNLLSCSEQRQRQSSVKVTEKDSLFMLVGSYGSADQEGVKLYSFNQESGIMNYISGIHGISNPSYLAPSRNGKRVYVVSENETETSTANALSLDLSEGKLNFMNSELTQGAAPCYIALSPNEDFVLTANYNGGNISVFRLNENGELLRPRVISFMGHGTDSIRQDRPHLHCISFTPDGKYTLAVDLGTDCVHMFLINAQDNNTHIPFLNEDHPQNYVLPAGSGPRHICFSPDQKFVYLITELSGDVIVMSYNDINTKIIQTIKADTLGARGSADIHITPDGRYLYASNRLKGDGIAIFKINQSTGLLTKVGYQLTGIHPRNFVISPNGKFLLVACRHSNEIQLYQIDPSTGLLRDTGKRVNTPEPTCLKFVKRT